MRRFSSLIVALATALAVGVTLAVAHGGGSEHNTRSDERPADGAGAISPELPRLVSAFRREQTRADRLPGDPVADLDKSGDARPGESPQFSRRMEIAAGPVFAWPESDGVCYAWAGSAGCTPTAVLAENGVIVGLRVIPGEETVVTVAGLARDGVDNVELVFRDGRSRIISIESNAFLFEPSEVPVEVRWLNPDGTSGARSL